MCNNPSFLQTLQPQPQGRPAPVDEAFANRLVQIAADATTGLMISIGHRTELFEALKQGQATSEELAKRSQLGERYVREWLAALTTAGIVDLDVGSNRYSLPEAHAGFLGRDAANGNMAAMFQFIAVLGGVESRIVDCFRHGGGVPYEAYDRFHEVMAEESAQTVVAALDEAILPLVPGLKEQLEKGVEVADIGCGSGRAMNYLAALYPSSHFHGIDLCNEAIDAARREANDLGLSNVEFTAMDATHLPGEARFDVIFTFDAVHDQAHPATVLSNIRRLLKLGGVYLMQDIDSQTAVEDNIGNPLAPFIYAISCMHCMTVSLAQNGDGLGAAWGEQLAMAMLKDAGFADVKTHRLEHDIMNLYFVCS